MNLTYCTNKHPYTYFNGASDCTKRDRIQDKSINGLLTVHTDGCLRLEVQYVGSIVLNFIQSIDIQYIYTNLLHTLSGSYHLVLKQVLPRFVFAHLFCALIRKYNNNKWLMLFRQQHKCLRLWWSQESYKIINENKVNLAVRRGMCFKKWLMLTLVCFVHWS